jgi:hypothetical protein
MMFSHEMLAGITGESKWIDRAEEIAFNSLPAAMTPDLKGLHYLTAPNQIQLDRGNKSPSIENSGDMFSYNPWQYRCCQHNAAMGWPYYAERMWMATRGDGLAAVFYGASKVKVKVGAGVDVTVTETTDYPFGETVHMKVETAKAVKFPLALRIPGWCERPAVKVNGKTVAGVEAGAGWAVVPGWLARRMREAAELGYATATDLADWLVREADVPFREAHHITGAVVKLAEARGVALDRLPLADLQSIDSRIDDRVFSALSVEASVAARRSHGGTAPEQVRMRVAEARAVLGME